MMSNLHKHAMLEFKAAGWLDENDVFKDEMQEDICNHILKLLDVFTDEGHSGTTAPYTVDLFSKLAMYKPLVPLTGEDWEWTDVKDHGDGLPFYQNKRSGNVFKDKDGAYDIDGKVFWEWSERPLSEDEEGYPGMSDPYKVYYTCRESRVPVTFPYTPKTEYVWKWSDAEPQTPKQNEQGFIR
jgi:hypothetical protein